MISRVIFYFYTMKKFIFRSLAKANKCILPSLTKQQVDPAKASKSQLALLAWRYFITKNSLK